MRASSNSYQFKVPPFNPSFWKESTLARNFVIPDETSINVYESSTSIKKLGELTSENEAIVRQIKAMKFLENNWDEEGAQVIPPTVIERALEWVKQANQLDYNIYLASPGPNQEILLMLQEGNREIELLLYPDREKYVKFEGTDFIEQGNLGDQEFHRVLKWLVS